MFQWLQPSKSKLTSQPPSQSVPNNLLTPGRTAYISTNTVEKKSFYANAPAGSQHAARLQKLALQQQPEYKPPEPNAAALLEGKVQRSITAQGEPRDYSNGSSISPPPPPPPGSAPPVGRQNRDPACRCQDCAHQHTARSPYRRSRTTPTTVDRYERDGTIAYHKKAADGELLISAPVGSQEARSMDDTAARILAEQAAASSPAGYVSRKGDRE
ncbi:MAG: hypothetical protein Q9167_004594 [Letrouitia subvulpina]